MNRKKVSLKKIEKYLSRLDDQQEDISSLVSFYLDCDDVLSATEKVETLWKKLEDSCEKLSEIGCLGKREMQDVSSLYTKDEIIQKASDSYVLLRELIDLMPSWRRPSQFKPLKDVLDESNG